MIGTLTELSRRPGMPSDVTLRKLIAKHPDFPIVRHGNKGRPYRIDLDAAEAFVSGLKDRSMSDKTGRAEQLRALALQILGPRHG